MRVTEADLIPNTKPVLATHPDGDPFMLVLNQYGGRKPRMLMFRSDAIMFLLRLMPKRCKQRTAVIGFDEELMGVVIGTPEEVNAKLFNRGKDVVADTDD